MSIFVLSGFSSFSPTGPGFLIPYLIKRGTNEIFVQELDEAYNIIEFKPFKSEHFEPVFFFTNPIPRELGQPGLLAYRLESDDIVLGEIGEIRSCLKSYIAASHSTPVSAFFDLEACMLIEDIARLHEAIDATARNFSNDASRTAWKSLEANAVHLEFKADSKQPAFRYELKHGLPDAAAELETLLEDRQDPQWIKKFRRFWKVPENRPQLLEIVCHWIETETVNSAHFPEVVLLALRSFNDNRVLRDAAIQWLRLGDYRIVFWGPIWLESNRRSPNDHSWPFMEKEGLLFLENTLTLAAHKSVEIWARIWTRIRRRRKLSHELLKLAERATPEFRSSSKFVQLVLANLASEPFAVEGVIDWLETASKSTVAWADTYMRILGGNPSDARLIAIGLEWLHTNGNINRWKAVWDAVRQAHPTHPDLLDIARSWLERAYPDVHVWPEVMSELIESGSASDTEIEIAGRWLASHAKRRETESYVRLSNLVNTTKSRYSLPPAVAISTMRSRLENEIEEFARWNGLRLYKSQPVSSVVTIFRDRELLPPNLLATIENLISTSNRAIQADDRREFSSNDVILFGDRLGHLVQRLSALRHKK